MPITDLLTRVTDSTTGRPAVTSLGVGGKALGASSFSLADATNWTTSSVHHFIIYEVDASGLKIQSSQTDWKGTLSGTTMSNLTLTGGTDKTYAQGAIVEVAPTSRWAKDLYDAVRAHTNQDGSLITSAVQTALNIGSVPADYTPLANPPSSVTANGNRSYTLTFAGQDYTNVLSPGKRLMTTRTVAAPTQSTSLNGTNQYFNDTTVSGMTFTDDFVVGAWVKLTQYPGADAGIISRAGAGGGWWFGLNSAGQVILNGANASGTNYRRVTSYQSVPLNKWVHITAQLDMSAYTVSTTTCYVMVDGVDVPASLSQNGTNPTALTQSGNLEVGSIVGGNLFPGKIAQVAVFSAKVTQATMRGYMSQGLTGTETSLISAYSFNNTLNDLNTTNANNLTANNGAVATNADSPFGGQGSGLISSTLDYAIVQSVSYTPTTTTVVCQVAEGCTIPTSGGVTSLAYSAARSPYGFPGQRSKWQVMELHRYLQASPSGAAGTYNLGAQQLNVPIGDWVLRSQQQVETGRGASSSTATTTVNIHTVAAVAGPLEDASSVYLQGPSAGQYTVSSQYVSEKNVSLTTATPYYVNITIDAVVNVLNLRGDIARCALVAENAYL